MRNAGLHKIMLAVALCCCGNARADYVDDRKAAMGLVNAGKHAEALAAFTKMAGGAKSALQKSDALEQAVASAMAMKKHDEAMGLARQIPLPHVSKTCQMRVLSATRQWTQLVEKFGSENIGAWPEGLDAEAFALRGAAYYAVKDGAKAAADLTQAAGYLTEDNSKGLALNALGDTYQHLLKDDVRALDAYHRVYTTHNIYKHCQAAMAAAGMFCHQGKPDEALKELQSINMSKVTIPVWRCSMLAAFGNTLALQGRKTEAIARYDEALRVEGILPAQWTIYEKAVERLKAGK